MALLTVFGIVRESLHGRALRVHFRLEPEPVSQCRAATPADMAERQVALCQLTWLYRVGPDETGSTVPSPALAAPDSTTPPGETD